MNNTLEAGKHWRHLYEKVKIDKQEALKRLREAQIQVKEVGHQMKEMVISFEVELIQECWKITEAKERHQTVVKHMNEYVIEKNKGNK